VRLALGPFRICITTPGRGPFMLSTIPSRFREVP
jgi:hypothetical protein